MKIQKAHSNDVIIQQDWTGHLKGNLYAESDLINHHFFSIDQLWLLVGVSHFLLWAQVKYIEELSEKKR